MITDEKLREAVHRISVVSLRDITDELAAIEAALSELETLRAKDKNFEVLKDHYASGYLGSLQAAIQYENVLRTIDNWLVCSPIATAEDMAASFLPMHNLIEEVLKAHTLPTPPAQEVK